MKRWLKNLKDNVGSDGIKKIVLVLAANKMDLISKEKEEMVLQRGRSFAERANMFFVTTSAKTGFNVEEVFMTAIRQIKKNLDKDPVPYKQSIIIGKKSISEP